MRLYSDLQSGTQRYYFNLESAPGGLLLGVGALQIIGLAPTMQALDEAFRNPATAALSIDGPAPLIRTALVPDTAVVSMGGLVPGLQTTVTITNALPPDYSALPDNLPTIITIMTIQPAPAALVIVYPELSLTPGGNIVTISPDVGALSLDGPAPAFPRVADVGALTISGLIPTMETIATISPETGELVVSADVVGISVPFGWVDDDPQPAQTWIDDPRA